jgi:hydrogenase/urease accessory protein HupE
MFAPPKRIIRLLTILVAIGLSAIPAAALAHLLPAQNGTLHVVENSVYTVVSVPVSALPGVDDNHDGLISVSELNRHSSEIAAQFRARFRLTNGAEAGRPLFTWAVMPQTYGLPPGGAGYVVVLQRTVFSQPSKSLALNTDLFGSASGEGQMTFRASEGNVAEVAVLNRASPTHRFFRGGLDVFIDFLRTGVEHILLGPDHLLFLLTVVVASAGWRYWASVITSFTLAHSLTLSLAVLGVVQVSPKLVEPAIAASIVLMAADNLIRQQNVGRERIALVMACGLLHGLGFASALGDIGVDLAHRLISLVGFNLGVELGQTIFLITVLGLAALARRGLHNRWDFIWTRGSSATAAMLGVVMLVERLLPGLPDLPGMR